MKRPIAEFNIQSTDGCLYKFLDLSYYEPKEWTWNFGDGSTSTLQNPQHAYVKPGTYTVTLSVKNAAGGGLRTRTQTIVVGKEVIQQQVVNVIDGIGFLSGVLAHRYASSGSAVEG